MRIAPESLPEHDCDARHDGDENDDSDENDDEYREFFHDRNSFLVGDLSRVVCPGRAVNIYEVYNADRNPVDSYRKKSDLRNEIIKE